MKENTAAVHVQVPVEVTSFLLNEKRTEITKIELKQRVTVLLVPNKHLETPNYKLERLRHDDPRLENLQASYTMIEEPDDEVGITRREKTKPKQEPVIKGILPETPAPVSSPKAVEAPAPAPAPVAAAAPVAAPAAAQPAGGGFFAWVKRLFGVDQPGGASASAPVAVADMPTVAVPEAREPRRRDRGERGERDRGERGGERGERGDRNGRRDGRRGEGRNGEQRAEGRERNGRRDGVEAVGDEPRRERAERPERADRGERAERAERPERGERPDRGERAERFERPERAERTDRGERFERPERAERAERSERGDRPERGERRPRPEQPVAQPALEDVALSAAPAAEGTTELAAAAVALEGAADFEAQGERRRRRRRGGRDRDDLRTEGDTEVTAEAADTVEATEAAEPVEAPAAEPAEAVDAESVAPVAEDSGEGRRRRRPRREREPVADAAVGDETVAVPEAVTAAAALTEDAPAVEAPEVQAPLAAAEAAPAPVAPVATVAPVVPATPEPVHYELPLDDLGRLAEEAGLQWVHSDAEKVRAAQEAIANAPKPVHVPREPKPVVLVDEGPLVLVETRKDLAQVKLPFETESAA